MDRGDASAKVDDFLAEGVEVGVGHRRRVDGPRALNERGGVAIDAVCGAGKGEDGLRERHRANEAVLPDSSGVGCSLFFAVFAAEVAVLERVATAAERAVGDGLRRGEIEEDAVIEDAHEGRVFVLREQLEALVVLGVGARDGLFEDADGERREQAGEDLLHVGAGPEGVVVGGRVELADPARVAAGGRDGTGLEQP